MWKGLGEKETGVPAFTRMEGEEICRTGIRIEKPLTLKLTGIMGDPLAPGRYRISLTTAQPSEPAIELKSGGVTASGNGAVMDVAGGAIEMTIRPSGSPVLACGVIAAPERN